jgi:C-8 sterol isomerase
MSAYIFEPTDLQRIVNMHLDAPLSERFDRIAETLQAVYGDHVRRQEEWIWSNAGGIMCSMNVLHTSPKEYLLFCGTAVGSEGHSGRHRAELFDIVINGELQTFKPDQFEATTLVPGDMSELPRRTTNGSHLGKECWLLEYARGNIMSLFPFALGDTIFRISPTFGRPWPTRRSSCGPKQRSPCNGGSAARTPPRPASTSS